MLETRRDDPVFEPELFELDEMPVSSELDLFAVK